MASYKTAISNARWRKRNPWFKFLDNAKTRCSCARHKMFHRYGGRGIECLLTLEEIKFLWFRDHAYNLERPSLDRIDSDGNYTVDNCRFIELTENVRRHAPAYTPPSIGCWA